MIVTVRRLPKVAMVEAVSSVWLAIYCIRFRVDTQALLRGLLVLALALDPYLEVGRPALALVQNPETGRIIQGINPLSPTVGLIQTLDQRAPHRRTTIVQVQHSAQAARRARTIGIVTEIRLLTGPLTPSHATDETRGIETGIEMARGGTPTPTLGTIRKLINHHLPGFICT